MPPPKAHKSSCCCCCPAEPEDPHLHLLGWTVMGEAGSTGAPEYQPCWYCSLCVCIGSYLGMVRLWAWVHWAPHTASGLLILGLDTFMHISNPDREPKHTFSRLSYLPSGTDLSLHIFEQNSKSVLLSLKRQKKHLWLLHTYFRRQSLPFTQTGVLPCMLLQAFPPQPTHILGQ